MEYRILGPLSVLANGAPIYVGGPREQRSLVALLLNANHTVTTQQLVWVLWDDTPPATAPAQIRNTMAQLRRHLAARSGGQAPISRSGAGFVVRIDEGELDATAFRQHAARARAIAGQGRLAEAAAAFREALQLWRGPALGDLRPLGLEAEAQALDEERMTCLERRIELDLVLGNHRELPGELARLVHQYPLRERLVELQMTALCRSGRRQDALDAFTAARIRLAEQAGLNPGPELVRLQQEILRDGEPQAQRVPAPTPPAPTLAAGPAQLPLEARGFAGRTEQLARLDALLAGAAESRTTLVGLLVGSGGVGKTTLAVRWAHRVRGRFPNGQLFVNLRGYSAQPPMRPIEALNHVLLALGVPTDQVPVDLDQAVSAYRSLLADRRVLVLLDNARDADQVRPLLPGAPGCLVLITSRERLSGLVAAEGAHRMSLDVLPETEAVELLTNLLGATRVAVEPGAVAELAYACGFLPLALRIAAAHLIDHPHRSLADQVTALRAGDRLSALALDGDQHAAILATFDLSYRALAEPERRLFRLLGLLPGQDLTPTAAAALLGFPPTAAARSLDRLAAAHLVNPSAPDRYTLHDLLRDYAAERGRAEDPEPEREAALARLLDWYLHTADAAARLLYPHMLRLDVPAAPAGLLAAGFDDRDRAMGWLTSERANLLAAVECAARHGQAPSAWLLVDTLRGYFWRTRQTVDWLSATEVGLRAAVQHGDLHAEAAMRIGLSAANYRVDRHRSAIDQLTTAADLSRRAGWLIGERAALNNLALVEVDAGDVQCATVHIARALELSRKAGLRHEEATALTHLGRLHRMTGQLELAHRYITDAIALYQTLEISYQSPALDDLGMAQYYLGRLEAAAANLTKALAWCKRAAHRVGEVEVLTHVATVQRDSGRYDEALENALSALALAPEVGARRIEAKAHYALGTVLAGREPSDAGHHFRRALGLAREGEVIYKYVAAGALIGVADAYRRQRRLDDAVTQIEEAVTVARRYGYRVLEGRALTTYAAIQHARGDNASAADLARQARDSHLGTGHKLGEARALIVLGQALCGSGDRRIAATKWRAARDIFTACGADPAELDAISDE